MTPEELEGDPGAAPERTRMAWQRTGFAVGTSAAAVARFAVEDIADPIIAVPLVALVAGAVGLIALPTAFSRSRHHARDRERDLRAFAATTTLTALVSIVLALIAPGAWR